MDYISYTILLSFLMTTFPYFYFMSQKKEFTNKFKKYNNLISLSIWGVISFGINFLLLSFAKMDPYIPAILGSCLAGTLVNYWLMKKYIDNHKVLKGIGIFCLFYFSSLFQLIPIWLFNIHSLEGSTGSYLSLFSNLILFGILLWIYFPDIKKDFLDFKKNFNQYLDTGFKWWLIGVIVMVVANSLILFLLPEAQANNEESVQSVIHAAPWISLISIGFIGPFIEEMVFRKSFREVFTDKWLFVLMSGLIFGSLHVILAITSPWDFAYIIPYSALGFAFGLMYVKTDNIFTSISLHVFHNFTLTLLSIVSTMMVMV